MDTPRAAHLEGELYRMKQSQGELRLRRRMAADGELRVELSDTHRAQRKQLTDT